MCVCVCVWSVPTSQRTQFVSIMKTNALMLLMAIIAQNCNAQIHCAGNIQIFYFQLHATGLLNG